MASLSTAIQNTTAVWEVELLSSMFVLMTLPPLVQSLIGRLAGWDRSHQKFLQKIIKWQHYIIILIYSFGLNNLEVAQKQDSADTCTKYIQWLLHFATLKWHLGGLQSFPFLLKMQQHPVVDMKALYNWLENFI